jgi:hypothetical protein
MSTCNRLDLQTLGSQPIMPKNLPDHCTWLSYLLSKWRFSYSSDDHIGRSPSRVCWLYKVKNEYYILSTQSNLIYTHGFWVSILAVGAIPSHMPFKYRCPHKKSIRNSCILARHHLYFEIQCWVLQLQLSLDINVGNSATLQQDFMHSFTQNASPIAMTICHNFHQWPCLHFRLGWHCLEVTPSPKSKRRSKSLLSHWSTLYIYFVNI